MANNPYVNKVEFGNQTIMDLTNDDVTSSDVLQGKSFHDRSGAPQTGTLDPYVPTDSAETAIADDDYFPFYDTSASGKKKTLWSNIKTKLKAYFDTIYSTFSGSYNDLSNKPTIPAAVAVKGDSESTYRTGNVNLTKTNIGLGNVGNFKAVSTVASQGLSNTEKSNARANIGAGTSSFSGSYNDLSNKPTIPTVNNGQLTIQQNGTNKATFMANQSGNATANIITDEFTSSVSSVNSVVTFNNLNPDYGYKLYVDIPDETTQLPTNLTNITVRKWTNKKRSTNSDGTINLAYTVTDTSIQYCLRILK